jgi:hypothetical protein
MFNLVNYLDTQYQIPAPAAQKLVFDTPFTSPGYILERALVEAQKRKMEIVFDKAMKTLVYRLAVAAVKDNLRTNDKPRIRDEFQFVFGKQFADEYGRFVVSKISPAIWDKYTGKLKRILVKHEDVQVLSITVQASNYAELFEHMALIRQWLAKQQLAKRLVPITISKKAGARLNQTASYRLTKILSKQQRKELIDGILKVKPKAELIKTTAEFKINKI